MSKMGISTVASYRGAQVFQAIGLSEAFVDEFFTSTSPLSVGLDVIARGIGAAFGRLPLFRPDPGAPRP